MHIPGTTYSPFELRRQLRARLDRDESVIGWCVAAPKPSRAEVFFQVSLALLPIVGQILHGVLLGAKSASSRLYLLTDRRLLVLRVDRSAIKPRRDGVVSDTPIEHLEVEIIRVPYELGDRQTFRQQHRGTACVLRVRTPESAGVIPERQILRFASQRDTASWRLVQGLCAVAGTAQT